MKSFLLTTLVCLFSILSFGQSKQLDSLMADTSVMCDRKSSYPHDVKMPQYIGGDKAYIDYLTSHFVVPNILRDGTNHQFEVALLIDVDGSSKPITLTQRSIYKAGNEEYLRVFKNIGKFKPGTKNGIPTKFICFFKYAYKHETKSD